MRRLGLLALCSCGFPSPDCADGYSRESDGGCAPLASADTGNTVPLAPLSGAISIDVVADVDRLQISDVCSGAVGVERVGAEVAGTISCSFEGEVGALLGGEMFQGTFSGALGTGGEISGPFVLDLGVFGTLDTVWTGVATDDELSGSLEGILNVNIQGVIEADVQYSGAFEASR